MYKEVLLFSRLTVAACLKLLNGYSKTLVYRFGTCIVCIVLICSMCLYSQSRPLVTTSTAVLPTMVAPIPAARTQSPVINTPVTHAAEMVHG